MSGIFGFHKQEGEALERALADWRAARKSPERLSGPARERILDAVGREESRRVRFELPSPLFLPARSFALAAVLPLVVLSLGLGYFLLPGAPALEDPAPRLLASRHGDEVVFVIANGDRRHSVVKGADPRILEDGVAVDVEQGVFRDRLDSDTDLVFYRID